MPASRGVTPRVCSLQGASGMGGAQAHGGGLLQRPGPRAEVGAAGVPSRHVKRRGTLTNCSGQWDQSWQPQVLL